MILSFNVINFVSLPRLLIYISFTCLHVYLLGYLGFLALDSPMFCNLFRVEPSDVGCVTMEVSRERDLDL